MRTHMELGRCEVGDVVVDGDLDDALDGHDGRGAHVVRRRRDGARVPVPLRVLASDESQELVTRSNSIPKVRELLGCAYSCKQAGRGRRKGDARTVSWDGTRSEQTARPRSARDTRTPESGSALKARSGAPSAVAPAFSSHLRAAAAIHAGGSAGPPPMPCRVDRGGLWL